MSSISCRETFDQQIHIPLPPDFNYKRYLDYLAEEKYEILYTIHETNRRIIHMHKIDALVEISYHPDHFFICIFLKIYVPYC